MKANLQTIYHVDIRELFGFGRFSNNYEYFQYYILLIHTIYSTQGPSWPCSYGSWIYNYQCLSPLTRVQIPIRQGVLNTTLCDKVCQWLAAGRWFSLGTPVSSTNKTDGHNITEILLKVALNLITPTLNLNCISGKVGLYLLLQNSILNSFIVTLINIDNLLSITPPN